MPLHVVLERGDSRYPRECTNNWKIRPFRRAVRELMENRSIPVRPGAVEAWLGISLDEWRRAKDSPVKYLIHRFPLLELEMTRADCITWLREHDLPVPPKSNCIFCPFQSDASWRSLKRTGGVEWRIALEVDEKIRNMHEPRLSFLHRRCMPLTSVRIPEDFGLEQAQIDLFDLEDAECDSGFCFL